MFWLCKLLQEKLDWKTCDNRTFFFLPFTSPEWYLQVHSQQLRFTLKIEDLKLIYQSVCLFGKATWGTLWGSISPCQFEKTENEDVNHHAQQWANWFPRLYGGSVLFRSSVFLFRFAWMCEDSRNISTVKRCRCEQVMHMNWNSLQISVERHQYATDCAAVWFVNSQRMRVNHIVYVHKL